VTKAPWALSVENNTDLDLVEVRQCKFSDMELAIDLGYANVKVEDNTFQGITRLAIWDHKTIRLGGWSRINDTNVFIDCPGRLYLHTQTSDITYQNGSSVNFQDADAVYPDDESVGDLGLSRYFPIIYHDNTYPNRGMRARLVMPYYLVEPSGRLRYIDRVNVSFWADSSDFGYLQGLVNYTVPAGVPDILVDINLLLLNKVEAPVELMSFWPNLYDGTGFYCISFRIGTESLYADNVSIDLLLDGDLVENISYRELVSNLLYGNRIEFIQAFYFEEGVHEVGLVVKGLVWTEDDNMSEEPVEIENRTFPFMRVGHGNGSEEVSAFLAMNDSYLLLDPRVSLHLDGFSPDVGIEHEHFIHMVGYDNNSITFSNTSYPENVSLKIDQINPLDLEFIDCRLQDLIVEDEISWFIYAEPYHPNASIVNSTFAISNSTLGTLRMGLFNCNVTVTDSVLLGGIRFIGKSWSTVSIEGCTIQEVWGSISGPIYEFSIRNSTLTGYKSYMGTISIEARYIKRLEVSNTTFHNTSLAIRQDFPEFATQILSVTDCRFTGNLTNLSVLWNHYNSNEWKSQWTEFPVTGGRVEGNTFSGAGTGVIMHYRLFESYLGENRFEDGAKALAWYLLQMDARPSIPGTGGRSEVEVVSYDPYEEFSDWWWGSYPYSPLVLDVTDGIEDASNPPQLYVVFIWDPPGGHMRMIAGFGQAVPIENHIRLKHPVWQDLNGLLTFYIDDWPWGLDHWEGPDW
jgi:hypothetical protein